MLPDLLLLGFMIIIVRVFGEEYKLRSSTLCSFLQPLITSSLFYPNHLFGSLSLYCFLNFRDKVTRSQFYLPHFNETSQAITLCTTIKSVLLTVNQ
jgi:hypothetical protein